MKERDAVGQGQGGRKRVGLGFFLTLRALQLDSGITGSSSTQKRIPEGSSDQGVEVLLVYHGCQCHGIDLFPRGPDPG